MDHTKIRQKECDCHELDGALDAISTLKKELELRLDEARDDCVREVLDNIIALIDAQDREYRRRKNSLCFQAKENT